MRLIQRMPRQMAVDVVAVNVLRFRLNALSWAAIYESLEAPLVTGNTSDLATIRTHPCAPVEQSDKTVSSGKVSAADVVEGLRGALRAN